MWVFIKYINFGKVHKYAILGSGPYLGTFLFLVGGSKNKNCILLVNKLFILTLTR